MLVILRGRREVVCPVIDFAVAHLQLKHQKATKVDVMSAELSAAIFAFSQETCAAAGIIPSKLGTVPTKEEANRHFNEVNAVCERMNTVAHEALKRAIKPAEMDSFRRKLEVLKTFPAGPTWNAVATALARQE